MAFVFILYVVYYFDGFLCRELILYYLDKFHLVMLYIIIFMCYWIHFTTLAEDFLSIFMKDWSVVFFFCHVFV